VIILMILVLLFGVPTVVIAGVVLFLKLRSDGEETDRMTVSRSWRRRSNDSARRWTTNGTRKTRATATITYN